MKRLLSFLLALAALPCSLPCSAQNSARMLSGVNVVTLTSYPFAPLDATRLVAFVNSSPVNAVLSPGNVLGFGAGTEFDALNIGPATTTIVCTCLIFSGTAPLGASSLALSAGQGVQLFAAGLNYYALVEGSSIVGLLGSANVWTGSNTYNAAVVLNGSLNGITVLGTQGGAGSQGYIQFGTGAFTQNTLSRFDSSGDLVNSFFTDSGAIGAYTGVNGIFSPSFNSNGAGTGFVGISQGTIPGSCNGGVDTIVADSVTTLLVDCKNLSGTTYYGYEVEAQPFYDQLNANGSLGPTVMQSAAPAASQWRFNVALNQVGNCGAGANGSVVAKVAYTDSGGLQTPTVATLTLAPAGLNAASGSWPLRVNSTNNISVQLVFSNCAGGSGVYDVHAWLERVK